MRLLRAFTQRKTSPLPPPVTEMMLVADQQVQLTFSITRLPAPDNIG